MGRRYRRISRQSATIPGISGPVSDGSSHSTIWGGAGGLLLSWEALDFGLRDASVDLARTLVTRANAGAELTRLDVGVKTADAFLRLAAAGGGGQRGPPRGQSGS